MADTTATGDTESIAGRVTACILLLMSATIVLDLRRTLQLPSSRAESVVEAIRLDPRRATAGEWELVPGIGPATAARIVEHRRVFGRDALRSGTPEDGWQWTLDPVPGVGPVTARRAAPYLIHQARRAGEGFEPRVDPGCSRDASP